jgi:hypothetical protein
VPVIIFTWGWAMPSMDYIVRIYRHEKDKPQKLVGVVEEVGAEEKKAFNNLDELWKILNYPKIPDKVNRLPRK